MNQIIETLFGSYPPFKAFSFEHFAPLIFFGFFSIVLFHIAKSKQTDQQWKIGFSLAMIPPFMITVLMVAKLLLGTFSLQTDLPLHICNFMAFFLPFMMLYKSQKLYDIFYYFILGGTMQALLTPDLSEGFPHWVYFKYWTDHSIMVILIAYCWFILKLRPSKNSILLAALVATSYLVFAHLINMGLDSNYFFTMHKPAGSSVLDYFGPWPIYLLCTHLLGILVFCLLYIPVWRFHKKYKVTDSLK